MATKPAHIGRALFVVVITTGVAGCGTVKEKTAPCKRPANLTSYAADPRQECGPMSYVNGDPATAMAAIEAMAAQ